MQDSFYNIFLKNWDKFRVRIKGQIMVQANKGVFTYSSLNLVLADCAEFWDSHNFEGGRWLIELEKAFPEKADLVKTILLKDMKFSEESEVYSKNNFLQYAVPVGSAAVGFSLSRMMGASNVVQAISTVTPAAVAFPITKSIVNSMDDKKQKEAIDSYIAQLEKYRLSIESIVKDI